MKRLMWPLLTESMTLPATLKHCVSAKADQYGFAFGVFWEAGSSSALLMTGLKSLPLDVWDSWVADWSCGEDVFAVAFHGALDAVGGHQDGAWEIGRILFAGFAMRCRSVRRSWGTF